ncbi:MAG TPA: hypothetical protein VFV70_02855 [Hyphomonadaceae bacterium]|nr:hypothetical protein [Hyphomonadaceae bacterium]
MRKTTLQFLHRERDELRSDIGFFEAGRREIVEIAAGVRKNITPGVLSRLMERLGRFEELIAAYEAKLD